MVCKSVTWQPGPALADDRPLLLIGCVRSGTTLTRDLLRRVPGVICPEETHFFRWAEPFRTPRTAHVYTGNPTLRRHRRMDGLSEAEFALLLRQSRTKAELLRRYVAAYARALGQPAPYRWCEKSPQNVYGAALMAQELPKARFLHLVRHPLNVVASLVAGRQVAVPDIHGACNYWMEAILILRTLAAAYPDRLMEVRYEDLVADVPGEMARILAFAEIDAPEGLFTRGDAHAPRARWRTVLTARQIQTVQNRCGPAAKRFGYSFDRA